MLRASWRIRKLAFPQGMLPRQSAVKALSSSSSLRAQPQVKEVEEHHYEPEQPEHGEAQQDSTSEAGPSNYFTSSRPSSAPSSSFHASSSAFFPSPSTSESPFSAAALFPSSSSSASSAEQAHLKALWTYINLPSREKDHRVATATWRQWQKLTVATKRYLSRQMHQQVLRTVVPSTACMRPYLDAVRRQSVPVQVSGVPDGGVRGWRKGQKARGAHVRAQTPVLGQRAGTVSEGLPTLPDIGNRFRSILEELDILGYTRPASHSPGSSPQDYRFALVYLARLGDSHSAEKIADTMRHRGVALNIRHIDARLLALVRYLERSRYRSRSMSGKEVDGVVETLWKILGDMNTHMTGKGHEEGTGEGKGQRPRRVTMLMLVQAINLSRRIFARSASAEANASASASAIASPGKGRTTSASRSTLPSASASTSSTSSSSSSSSSILPLGIPASRASITDKALELDLLLEEVLAKGYGLDLQHATFAALSVSPSPPSSSASSSTSNSSGAALPGGIKMNGVALLALVDHFGRKDEPWKMLSVLHAYGETRPWHGLDRETSTDGSGVGPEGGEEEGEEQGIGLKEMLRREEEGRRGMTIFGRARGAVSSPSPADEEPSSSILLPSSCTSPISRSIQPSQRLFNDLYPQIPLIAPSPLPSPIASSSSTPVYAIDTSYDDSTQRTDVYTTALAHSLRSDDWALTLHILGTAVTSAREVRGEWIVARWGREMLRMASVSPASDTVSPSVSEAEAEADAQSKPLPTVPPPRISLDPEWFLRTHVRMARHGAGARHMAKLQDLMMRAVEDNKAEVRALAAMEGWASTPARTGASQVGDAEVEETMDVEAEARITWMEDMVQQWDLSWEEVEQLEGIDRLDEPLVKKGKGSSNVFSAAPDVEYVGAEPVVGEREVVRAVPPHMEASALLPAAAASTSPSTVQSPTASASASASASAPLASSPSPTPAPTSLPSIVPSAPPSRHLLTALSNHLSLRSILAYSLHRKHLQSAVRTRSNLRFEANQLLRRAKREEEERERMGRAERKRWNVMNRNRVVVVEEAKEGEGRDGERGGAGVVVA